jgi:hypothetical protein
MWFGKLSALLRGSNRGREVVQVDPGPEEHIEEIEVTIDSIPPDEDLWITFTTPSGDPPPGPPTAPRRRGPIGSKHPTATLVRRAP